MIDNDKLLKDFGEPVIQHHFSHGIRTVTIKHAFLIGKHNVKFINICEYYKNNNKYDRANAELKIRRLCKEERYNTKNNSQ